MFLLQFYSLALVTIPEICSRSATRKNIETSVVEEGKRTFRHTWHVSCLKEGHEVLVARTNAIILLPVANLTQSVHADHLDKVQDPVTCSTATYIEKYSVRNSGCSNVLERCENTENTAICI
jgi:hypothetical protein